MVYKNLVFTLSLLCLLFMLTHNALGQVNATQDDIYKIYDEFMGEENSELNNGASFLQQYRTIDQSHLFFNTKDYVKGEVDYKNQSYKTQLKYDLFNDLVVVKYINSSSAFTLGLNSGLVNSFEIGNYRFVKLKNEENIHSFYRNGFFEEAYFGDALSLYIKHQKHLKKSTTRNKLYYSFKEESTYLLKYKNNYYEIDNKRDIIKIVPEHKKMIKDFFTKKRKFNRKSLHQIFSLMDKTIKNEA